VGYYSTKHTAITTSEFTSFKSVVLEIRFKDMPDSKYLFLDKSDFRSVPGGLEHIVDAGPNVEKVKILEVIK
jgi:hypothetical protein